jgi:putative ABC transport system permease protein
MLFKMSLRNLRKSIQNYVVYFSTLIIGVAIFYIFNALGEQSVMLKLSSATNRILAVMMQSLSVVSVFVAVVFGLLIVYASSFMMKRRKKEFGVYMLLGMSKGKIAAIMVIETMIIGIISLIIGLLVGIGLSQAMSIIVANMFEKDMTEFRFMISSAAVVKTLIFFAAMYGVVILLDVFVVGRTRLISLLNASKKNEKNFAKNKYICVIVFLIAVALLGTAYYRVTRGADALDTGMLIMIQIVKGIIGTFLLFWSVSGMLLAVVQRNKRFYYKGLNCFSVKELSGRINTTVISGSIICLLLFFTICILSSAVALRNSQNKMLKRNIKADVNITKGLSDSDKSALELAEDAGIDFDKLSDYVCVSLYNDEYITYYDVMGDYIVKYNGVYTDEYADALKGFLVNIISESDYNKIAKLYGQDTVSLGDDEYAILTNTDSGKEVYGSSLADGKTVSIRGVSYKPVMDTYIEGIIHIDTTDTNDGVLILPDSAINSDMVERQSVFAANYADMSKEEISEYDDYLMSDEFMDKPEYGYIETGIYLKDAAMTLSATVVFVGLYLGIVFLISSAAILSLKELSQAADNRDKYKALRRMGVDNGMINRSLLAQSGFFFGLPLFIAIIHSCFGLQTAQMILTIYGKGEMIRSIIMAGLVILGIYGIYFFITYFCSRKIISE